MVGGRVPTLGSRVPTLGSSRIGRATWYVIPGSHANGIIEVRGAAVTAVGIADRRLSGTRAGAQRLLGSS